jgi:hypothetical protein
MLVIVVVPSSSIMYLRGTILLVVFMTEEKTQLVLRLTPAKVVVAGLCSLAAANQIKNPILL